MERCKIKVIVEGKLMAMQLAEFWAYMLHLSWAQTCAALDV
jgi:hypothetical protein